MPKLIDMQGRVFGLLTVLSRDKTDSSRGVWICACKCGAKTSQHGYELRRGAIVSCGCRKRSVLGDSTRTHGMTGTKEYRAWFNMRARCKYETREDFARYGALGITVCAEWDASFAAFFKDMGLAPSTGHSMDRIDPAGNYCKENCRWADAITQANNKRRVKKATINGETHSIADWCRKLNLPHNTIAARVYDYGWSPEKALLTPVKKQTKR